MVNSDKQERSRIVQFVFCSCLQGVEVAMFSSGYFKNETGEAEDCPMGSLDR